ncbi:MAG: response regulator [Chloroflexi bacterium]|nr:response regulator [Chloroflexota bacterium]
MTDTQIDQSRGDILIIDDTLLNLRLLSDILSEQGYEVRGVPDGQIALDMANLEPPDLILLDIKMPGLDGYKVCRRLKANEQTHNIPVIFISALEEVIDKVRGFEVGGVDYIAKPFQIEDVLARVETHLTLHNLQKQLQAQNAQLQHEIAERKQAEAALQRLNEELEQRVAKRTAELANANVNLEAEIAERMRTEEERIHLSTQIQEQAQRVQQIVDTVPQGVFLLDAELRILLANPPAQEHLAELAGAKVGDTLTHLAKRSLEELLTSPPQGLWHDVEVEVDDSPRRFFEVIASPMETRPEMKGWVLVLHDATQEREVQARIHQQERLAAVGQLAAGIAHDFNNIMAVIILYSQMALRSPDLSPKLEERMGIINQQGRQASELINQILDFSRSAVLDRQSLDLVPLLKEQVKLWQRTLPENIQINLAHGTDDYIINADPTRIQQAFMNLAVNARDAMHKGGDLYIGLEQIQIDHATPLPLPEMQPGEWVRVTVTDTGTGISDDILPHIFDPFFTTKSPGEGTGLGLAQVYGIVTQHDGLIDVSSKVREGTTFIIYLPALQVLRQSDISAKTQDMSQGHGETILVVEDNTETRAALVSSLELLNYQPLEASNGREALDVFQQHGNEIALVLSDMVMPEMGGQALAQTLRQRNPAIRIILLTGHPMVQEIETLQKFGIIEWLKKPSDLAQLAQVLTRALEKDGSGIS